MTKTPKTTKSAKKSISNSSPKVAEVVDYELKNSDKMSKRLILNISVFLLGRDNMKNIYWTVTSSAYSFEHNRLFIGIKTIDGKTGTVLKNMRSNVAELAEYLKQQKLTPHTAKIVFYIDKEREKTYLENLNSLIETVEMNLNLGN